jgi:tetratricopeptide (TPR) repeat protein
MVGETDDAVAEATIAIEIYRQLFDDLGELRGRGYLGQAYAAQEKFDEAMEQFEKGLQQATSFQIDAEVAGFMVDIAAVLHRQGRVREAIPYMETAILRMIKVGSAEMFNAGIPTCLSWYEQAGDIALSFHLAEQLAGAALLTRQLRSLLYWIVHILKITVDAIDGDVMRNRLARLRQIGEMAREKSSDDDVSGWIIFGEIVDLFDIACTDRGPTVLETARDLDERTQNWLQLARFIETGK